MSHYKIKMIGFKRKQNITRPILDRIAMLLGHNIGDIWADYFIRNVILSPLKKTFHKNISLKVTKGILAMIRHHSGSYEPTNLHLIIGFTHKHSIKQSLVCSTTSYALLVYNLNTVY